MTSLLSMCTFHHIQTKSLLCSINSSPELLEQLHHHRRLVQTNCNKESLSIKIESKCHACKGFSTSPCVDCGAIFGELVITFVALDVFLNELQLLAKPVDVGWWLFLYDNIFIFNCQYD